MVHATGLERPKFLRASGVERSFGELADGKICEIIYAAGTEPRPSLMALGVQRGR